MNLSMQEENALYSYIMLETYHILEKYHTRKREDNEDKYYLELAKFYQMVEHHSIHKKEELLHWARERFRYPFLNLLLEKLCYHFLNPMMVGTVELDYTDYFMYQNLDSMIDFLYLQLEELKNSTTSNKKLSPIKKETTDSLVCEILKELDPTLKWLNLYYQAKKKKQIFYRDEHTEEEVELFFQSSKVSYIHLKDSNFCTLIGNTPYIYLNRTNTINDVSTTIHELIHFIDASNHLNYINRSSLNEFPSIFYELYSLFFLYQHGYRKEEIEQINENRLSSTFHTIENNIILLSYLKIYFQYSDITEEIDTELTSEILKTMDHNFAFDLEKIVQSKCDQAIEFMTLFPFEFFESYPYVIGNYLAHQAMKKLSTDFLMQMKDCTEHLSKIDPYNAFQMVGCDMEALGLEPINSKKKVYHKKNATF